VTVTETETAAETITEIEVVANANAARSEGDHRWTAIPRRLLPQLLLLPKEAAVVEIETATAVATESVIGIVTVLETTRTATVSEDGQIVTKNASAVSALQATLILSRILIRSIIIVTSMRQQVHIRIQMQEARAGGIE
jgi:hypothetical protein